MQLNIEYSPAISKKASASANVPNDPVEESENARLRQRIDQLEREMAEVQALYPDVGRRNAHVEERRDQLVSEVPPSYN
ncbi:hypothetical protein H0H93_009791 [Arthromyces matolae]|nr:hypothetical protein H0H93_009791 [Arthromyces matolae]